MTNEYEIADDSRETLIWTKEQLLAPLLPGMEPPPHEMRLGQTERDYYGLRTAGVPAGPPPASGPEGEAGEPVWTLAATGFSEAGASDEPSQEAAWTPPARAGDEPGDEQ
jgi:hypothetical protein